MTKFPKRYTAGLSKKDRAKQLRSLKKARRNYRTKRGSKRYVPRPKLKSFKDKKSSWTQQFQVGTPTQNCNVIAETDGGLREGDCAAASVPIVF